MKIIIWSFILLTSFNLTAQNWSPTGNKMKSKWAKEVNAENVWTEYPRPQLKRTDWMNLNGLWEYALIKNNEPTPKKFHGKILVPFCIESSLSGVGKSMLSDDRCGTKENLKFQRSGSLKML